MITADQDVNYKITQGDSFELQLTYRDEDDNAIDLTGYQILIEVRDKPGGSILSAVCTIGDGILIPSPANGVIDINISPRKTSLFNYPRASYQIQGTDQYGNKVTFLQGWFQVNAGTIN